VSAATVISLSFFIFLLVDDRYPQTCTDEVHYYVRQPLCVIQGVIFVGGLSWMIAVQLLIAWRLWAAVVMKVHARE
jgi:hypothetical protein